MDSLTRNNGIDRCRPDFHERGRETLSKNRYRTLAIMDTTDKTAVSATVGPASEGSYGLDGSGIERPQQNADPVCPTSQDLSMRCDI